MWNSKRIFLASCAIGILQTLAYSQSCVVQVSGVVSESESEKWLANIPIVILENNDTLAILITDAVGAFCLDTSFDTQKQYTLTMNNRQFFSSNNQTLLKRKEDSICASRYSIELRLIPVKHDRFDSSIYFEFNETQFHQQIEIDALKQLLTENPSLCIEFVQTIHPNETQAIAELRKSTFLNALESANVPMEHIRFKLEVLKLDIEKQNDARSRIEGVLVSIEGSCK